MKESLPVLHLEDVPQDALLVRETLERAGVDCEIRVAGDAREFQAAMERGGFKLILSDSSVRDIDGMAAMRVARDLRIPFVVVSGSLTPERTATFKAAGAAECVSKDDLSALPAIVSRFSQKPQRVAARPREIPAPMPAAQPMQRLIGVVQELSLARSLERIQQIVRRAARELTGADGATFVLREGDLCHYADEDAIAPLWKGCRFPMSACISGWAMLNRESVAIEDIYADDRIPADAYRPTFVKSLVMVPIRTAAPIGAIGNYWATSHQATAQEIELLQALADSTSIAMENVALYNELEARVQERTQQLETANADLESFSYSVSHDLRAPLRAIGGFSEILEEDYATVLDEKGRAHLARITSAVAKMNDLIEDLLDLARLDRAPIRLRPVDLAELSREILKGFQEESPERVARITIPESIMVSGDPGLLRIALENLLSNAWKYSSKRECTSIEVGCQKDADCDPVYFVRDEGAGFDTRYASKLFGVFQRFHADHQFPGTGVGLATVQRIIRKHGGRIWAESEVDRGATFFFTLH